MKDKFKLVFIYVILIFGNACQQPVGQQGEKEKYEIELMPLNMKAYEGNASGTFTIERDGDSLRIKGEVNNVPPGIMHLQHLHAFEDGKEAACGSAASDKNNDGYVDLSETRDFSGITMVPLHDNPVNLEIKANTYPMADSTGSYTYEQAVSMESLKNSLKEKYNLDSITLGNFVLYVHGVQQDTMLPETVKSLPDVPAHVTLPIACGELK